MLRGSAFREAGCVSRLGFNSSSWTGKPILGQVLRSALTTLQEVLQCQLPLALSRGSQWAVPRPSLNQRASNEATRQENKLIESIISITAYPLIGTREDGVGGGGEHPQAERRGKAQPETKQRHILLRRRVFRRKIVHVHEGPRNCPHGEVTCIHLPSDRHLFLRPPDRRTVIPHG